MDRTGFETLLGQLLDEAAAEGFPPATFHTDASQDGLLLAWIQMGAERFATVANVDFPELDIVVEVASGLQDGIVEAAYCLGRPPVWPACPAHPDAHPLDAQTWGGESVWVCPRDDRVIRPIRPVPSG